MSETDTTDSDVYVLTVGAVRRAINALKPLSIHETLPVYLHIRRNAHVLQRFHDLQPDWNGEVHNWLDVPGGPPNKPHFRPFTSRGKKLDSFWMAENLAGSYAQSSLRGMRSLYVDSNDKYLLPTHTDGSPNPQPIFARVFGGGQVPAWALAAFLFRNRAFYGESIFPVWGWDDLLVVFQTYFDWTSEERGVLFDWDAPDTDCFEEMTVDE